MIRLDVRADLGPLQRGFVAFHSKQAPFAIALALTTLAKGVQGEETDSIVHTFDSPTPFTAKSIAVRSATKTRPVATVAARDIAAQYLEPYVDGGPRFVGAKRRMIVPKGAPTNQYGNLTKGQMQRLKAKPGVFFGRITFRKSGQTVSGIFQRGQTPRGERRKGGGEYGTKGKNTNIVGGARTTLTMLLQFDDTTPTRKHLPFYERAQAHVRRNAAPAFTTAMRQALATARR